MDRRDVLTGMLGAAVVAVVRPSTAGASAALRSGAEGVAVPAGFTVREVARGGSFPAGGPTRWHRASDGAATFADGTGGWTLVSNSEVPVVGGATALDFSPTGEVVGARRVLERTSGNCAGGPTPWGTWLSCEEHEQGLVWECQPFGTPADAEPRRALGRFVHEAAVVDPTTGEVYLTEDRTDGLLYRFVPDRAGDLSNGTLLAARITDRTVQWLEVPGDPADTSQGRLRDRLAEATTFRRGEGAWFGQGALWFTTTADARVWRHDPTSGAIEVVHDGTAAGSPLQGPDNIVVTPDGTALVAEDGGNLELVAIAADGAATPWLTLSGSDHVGSEVTGPALSPDGSRLYIASQRGGTDDEGVIYEVQGPFPWVASSSPSTTVPASADTAPTAPPTTSGEVAGEPDDGEAQVVWGIGASAAVVLGAALAWRRRR